MKEAYYYEKKENNFVQCHLCPHECKIKPGAVGLCRVRKNECGTLYSLNYGKISSYNFDPIEKKPLYHFYPGKTIFSIGTFGCNFNCDFCQNYTIAQQNPATLNISTEQIMDAVKSREDNIGIAYTYNEPTIFYEFMLDTAKEANKAGYKNVVVTNGFINKKPLEELLQYVDAMNIDLKAFNNKFYESICRGKRLPVMETIRRSYGKTHIEITLLLIDDENTDEKELNEMFKWIADIDKNIPLHISRYFPANRMANSPTKIVTIRKAKSIAKKYLNYVYIGNV